MQNEEKVERKIQLGLKEIELFIRNKDMKQ
jgi:hypothetical protein